MTYQQCLDFLYSQLPMFQRDGSSAFKKDLTNTQALCDALDQPQSKFRSIHVAGTNGKGSVCHLLAAILQAEGYKVGLYTSPHYFDFRERVKINGRYISKQAVVSFVQRIRADIDRIQPSFFELTVAMAFDHFARNEVDFAVVETGLGGRLDSTNIITPLISIITNISLDHQSLLGDTLSLIAVEKAGIIKSGVPVIIGERNDDTDQVFISKAVEMHSPICFAEDKVSIESSDWKNDHVVMDMKIDGERALKQLKIGLNGAYQAKNIRTVLASVDVLCQEGTLCISEESIRSGAAKVVSYTQMQGRWQKLKECPDLIVDSGHNVAGLSLAIEQLTRLERKQLRIVFGVSKDKDYFQMLQILPQEAIYYWCSADLPRSLPVMELQAAGHQLHLHGNVFPSVASALKSALESADPQDVVYVGGSSFVVGEVLQLSL